MDTKLTIKLARERFSPRAFKDEPVNDELIKNLLKEAGNAPSSMNEQPWRFIYAHKSEHEKYNKLYACLDQGNQEWAGSAGVLMAVCATPRFKRNNRVNRHAFYDTGQAMGQFSLMLTESGLHMRQMGGFNSEKARIKFNLGDNLEPVIFAAIGYLEDTYKRPERTRLNINETIIGVTD